jgi:hypothetical protein
MANKFGSVGVIGITGSFFGDFQIDFLGEYDATRIYQMT